ncbi:hypothetical protein C8256_25255 [Kluyvera genomosp. 2]|uniref:DNA replication protein n=1 Tax=Kluyvera genomosp. 2 TaxID=2774054 RepID=A0A2T2XUW2_9ENTR|nr:hypothetical protein C8256_25255 [Kluyvera genomosp. 2]
MGSCAAPSAKGDDKFITTDYLQQCRIYLRTFPLQHTFLDRSEKLSRFSPPFTKFVSPTPHFDTPKIQRLPTTPHFLLHAVITG